jgi:hypothetical protein
MSDMSNLVMQALGGDAIQQMSRAIGADETATKTAISGALPVLLGALARNSSSASGAEGLLSALTRDHDGSILDDVAGFLGSASSGPGDGILGHVLGGRRGNVENGLSRMSGLDAQSIAKLLMMLAPIVMGVLGRTQRQRGFDASGLGGLLTDERREAERQAPDAMGAFEQLLDTDGDGQVMDDVAKIGTSLLGKFLK